MPVLSVRHTEARLASGRHIAALGTRLDSGGFRHALLEGLQARLTWGGMIRIPPDVMSLMDEAYRTELATHVPDIGDNRVYRLALVEAGARWNIFHVVGRLPEAVRRDRP